MPAVSFTAISTSAAATENRAVRAAADVDDAGRVWGVGIGR